MLTLTHAIIGFLLCYLFFKDKRLALIGLIFGALPDLDGLLIFVNYSWHLQVHRTLLHPFIWGAIFALPAMLIFRRRLKWYHVGLAGMIGYSAHIICDLLFTSWPIPIFWPFSNVAVAFPVLEPMLITVSWVLLGAFLVLLLYKYEYFRGLLPKKIPF
jgi:membrane-bound metal-dependent hydrolase YbcI (DUF457 family)